MGDRGGGARMSPRCQGDESADHDAIRNALERIAHLADLGTPEEYLECFTDDAVWGLSSAAGLPIKETVLQGRNAIYEGVMDRRRVGVQGPGTYTAHAVSTTSFEVDGDTARVRSLFMYYTGINTMPELAAVGRYSDTFERADDGRWLLSHRNITRG